MRHRVELSGLPSFGPPEILRPRPSVAGARISGVILVGRDLVFRADRGMVPGIHAQSMTGEDAPRLVWADTPGHFHINPVQAGHHIVVQQGVPNRVPSMIDELVFLLDGREVVRVPGQSVGVSGDGHVAVVADVQGKALHRVDLVKHSVKQVASLVGNMDVQLAPLISVDHDGTHAVFMDARVERCDASLELLDLGSGQVKRLLGPLPAPSFACATFTDEGSNLVVHEMRLGKTPQFRLLKMSADGRTETIVKLDIAQPEGAPAIIHGNTVVLPLSLTTHPFATHGPSDLCVVGLRGGTVTPLTRSGDVQGNVRVVGEDVVVEGGEFVVRVPSQPHPP